MLKQLFDALLFLYEDHLIVHRDIKPENVLVFRNSCPHSDLLSEYTEFLRSENSIIYKLCGRVDATDRSLDFGFSGSNHVLCGTQCIPSFLFSFLDYTRPDVYAGEADHSLQSDLWSLGIVCYFALFMRNPYLEWTRTMDRSLFLDDCCVEKQYMESLGPRLKSIDLLRVWNVEFFTFALRFSTDYSLFDIHSLYNELFFCLVCLRQFQKSRLFCE